MEDPAAHFSQLLNGKVQDYFKDNSGGIFTPRFDVYGPVLLDAPMADYGKDVLVSGTRIGDIAAEKAMYHACVQLDEQVDFSRYDADGDGVVDMILFYYAGYDQASGGPSDAIWSHHQDIQSQEDSEIRDVFFDGVRLGYYFCTSELRGNEGSVPIGIGSTVHEMGHVLGLPDFYDTDGGENGVAGGLYQFSPMCRGLYNDNGDTPPYFNVMERILLGWMPEENLLPLQEGWMHLPPVQQQVAAYSPTSVEGEFFLYECRGGTGWDAPLPAGLIVYHVDRSVREVDGIPAVTLWNEWRTYNNLNSRNDHPCFYVVPPMAPEDCNYAPAVNPATLVFPGVGMVRSLVPVDWAKERTGIQISCVDFQDGEARFRVLERNDGAVCGLVLDADGAPMLGVTVKLWQDGEVVASDFTSMDGYYELPTGETDGNVRLSAEKFGYRPVNENLTLGEGELVCHYLQLFAHQDRASDLLSKYDPSLSAGYFPECGPLMGAVRFTAQELTPYVGRRLNRIVCYPYVTEPDEVSGLNVMVDFGDNRILNQCVEDAEYGKYLPVTVDITESVVRIPEGMDIYVGYGFQEQGSNYPFAAVYPGTEGNSFYAPFSLEAQVWKPLYLEKAGFYMDLMLSTVLEEYPADSLPELGYSCIRLREGPYYAGEQIEFQVAIPDNAKLTEQRWFLDDEPLNASSIKLTRGEHTLEVHLVYADGREEDLCVELQVN